MPVSVSLILLIVEGQGYVSVIGVFGPDFIILAFSEAQVRILHGCR